MKIKVVFLLFLLQWSAFAQLPEGFVYVDDVIPDIQLELRYCLHNNFVGEPVAGYRAEVCILTTQAANALKKVQEALKKDSLSLKVFDAYRPQQAVNYFAEWAKNVNDTLMKQQYYPEVDKRNLFRDGYIASRSRHSSGSTIDLTIVDLKTGKELDMGTPYDYFGKASWYLYDGLTKKQKENRALLHNVMSTNGFRHYPKEWWHFTLRGEPYKNQYFNFPVE
ncbi:M15 family metallopeptidase [Lacinutrix sp. C3R15]|uniref:M15 family metallopeptidase n=1 Tax=Flavobacteriaceae TaxID=49546 RepID=UPI001C08B723|nr:MULTISPECIES: M15 family metallopeptidase [Flavobacteriaceae]MBU2939477.1 M15 family metallopeptidase [Lacinutrix sp. C3R15]MDO6622792.1 M15 family metallopeptidase [Oceanihabitans sp. 1_MG-2023]